MKNHNKTTSLKIPTAKEFLEAFQQLDHHAERVCGMLVQMVDANPNAYKEICAINPKMTYNLLGNLERVGRGQLYFGLLCDSSPGARRLLSLPASQQKAAYETPVKVVNQINGKQVVEEKFVYNLSPSEARVALTDGGQARTIEEQIKIVTAPLTPAPRRVAQRYLIVGDICRVEAKTDFDIPTMKSILEKMEANALKNLGANMKKNQIRS